MAETNHSNENKESDDNQFLGIHICYLSYVFKNGNQELFFRFVALRGIAGGVMGHVYEKL